MVVLCPHVVRVAEERSDGYPSYQWVGMDLGILVHGNVAQENLVLYTQRGDRFYRLYVYVAQDLSVVRTRKSCASRR